MAVDRVAKVLVAIHQDPRSEFFRSLHRAGILHITRAEETQAEAEVVELDARLGRLAEAIELLAARGRSKGGLLGGEKVELSRGEFERTVREYDPAPHLERLRELTREADDLNGRERAVRAEQARLQPWRDLAQAPAEALALDSTAVLFGLVPDEAEADRVREALAGREAGVELVGEGEAGVALLVAASRSSADEVQRLLSASRFEPVDLHGVTEPVAATLARLELELAEIGERRARVSTTVDELAAELLGLKVAADALATKRQRLAVQAAQERTESVTLVYGWVRERDFAELERLVGGARAAALVRLDPEPGEEPPVVLLNRKPLRPFELVLDLYSMPSPRELDPTALLAPFFAIFFGFCLTDAGYGIALVVIAALLMRKLGAGNKLIGMLFIGGFFTIVAGALVGGWFGDLPDKLGWSPLLSFKNRLMWFDPLTNPMPFFILSLGLGYVHMIYGIVIEIIDCLRVGRIGDALLGQLPWFVALNSLVAMVLFGRSLPGWASPALLVLVLASVAAIVVFTQRAPGAALPQAFWFALFWLLLVFFAARLGGLPAAFLLAKWAALVAFGGLYAVTAIDLVRSKRLKPVPLALGAAGLLGLGLYLAGVLPWIVAGLLGVTFFFSAPANRQVAGKLAWGGYALYGATSYVGVVLSYIRIMALGMVTGGIAMAINTVAWMVTGIPVLGVVIAVVALAVGHTYNLAVNVLGAFVHTLRLNYVEFFPRFYTGGGEPFVAFREASRFVEVRE